MEEKVLKNYKNNIRWFVFGIIIGLFTFWIILIFRFGLFEPNNNLSSQIIIFAVVLYLLLCFIFKSEITITNKRVYGKLSVFKKIDLPLDSITGIALVPILAIKISTPSEKINVNLILEIDEMYSVLSKLINQRTQKTEVKAPTQSNADELMKYKQLLDAGAITEEEYNQKKKELLGL